MTSRVCDAASEVEEEPVMVSEEPNENKLGMRVRADAFQHPFQGVALRKETLRGPARGEQSFSFSFLSKYT